MLTEIGTAKHYGRTLRNLSERRKTEGCEARGGKLKNMLRFHTYGRRLYRIKVRTEVSHGRTTLRPKERSVYADQRQRLKAVKFAVHP